MNIQRKHFNTDYSFVFNVKSIRYQDNWHKFPTLVSPAKFVLSSYLRATLYFAPSFSNSAKTQSVMYGIPEKETITLYLQ